MSPGSVREVSVLLGGRGAPRPRRGRAPATPPGRTGEDGMACPGFVLAASSMPRAAATGSTVSARTGAADGPALADAGPSPSRRLCARLARRGGSPVPPSPLVPLRSPSAGNLPGARPGSVASGVLLATPPSAARDWPPDRVSAGPSVSPSVMDGDPRRPSPAAGHGASAIAAGLPAPGRVAAISMVVRNHAEGR